MPSAGLSEQAESALVSIERFKADRFLDQLAHNPFIAIVIEGDRVCLYARSDIDSEHLALVKQTIRAMEEEDKT